MKHTNKKGFTIVELVIVIAVIAILAAVLIPTFSNLIKKANISNDTAIAKNLNTAAISAQADTFAQAIEAAKEAGYLVAHLNAKAENVYFVWDDGTNQFLLYDLKAGKVLYSNTKEYSAAGENWYFAVNTKAEKDAVLEALANVNCNYLVGSVDAVNEILAEGGEIYLDESLALDETHLFNINSTATINLGSSALNTSGIVETDGGKYPIAIGANGKVTLNGGHIAVASKVYNLDNKLINTVLHTAPGSTLTVVGTEFDSATYNSQMKIEGTAMFKDVVIKATKSALDTRGNAQVTLDNVTINIVNSAGAAGYGNWVHSCNILNNNHVDADATPATVTIISGTFTREAITGATRGGLNTCGGDIVVKGGTFTADDNLYFSFSSDTDGEIRIEGGTFGDKTFGDEGFNEAYLLSLCVKVGNNDNADVYSVTKDPETGYFTITRK